MAEIITGQVRTYNKAIALTGTAVRITTDAKPCMGLLVKADPANAANIFIGGDTVNNDGTVAGNGFKLGAGESVYVPCTDPSQVYINGTAGDFVSCITG